MIRPYQWGVAYVDLDPPIGSEQGGHWPVLIVSNEPFNQAMPTLSVLPLSSTGRRLYPAEVSLPKGVAGPPRDSIVMATRSGPSRNNESRASWDILPIPLLANRFSKHFETTSIFSNLHHVLPRRMPCSQAWGVPLNLFKPVQLIVVQNVTVLDER